MKQLFTVPVRRWAYGICLAIAPVATVYGLVTDAQAAAWLGLAAAVFTPTLALTHMTEDRPTGAGLDPY